jgi:hypothetical protein
MRSKLTISALAVACTLGSTAAAYAQVVPEAQPPVESAVAARIKAHHRERTILRPSTTTGMSRGTPGARHNFYKEPGN